MPRRACSCRGGLPYRDRPVCAGDTTCERYQAYLPLPWLTVALLSWRKYYICLVAGVVRTGGRHAEVRRRMGRGVMKTSAGVLYLVKVIIYSLPLPFSCASVGSGLCCFLLLCATARLWYSERCLPFLPGARAFREEVGG
jgi:hypothetical protein